MIISRLHDFGVKLQQGDITVILDNIGLSGSGNKPAKLKSDLSINSLSFSGVVLPGYDEDTFRIFGPGQYEHGGVHVEGVLTTTNFPEENINNTIYKIELAGVVIMSFGFISKPDQFSDSARSLLSEADVVIVPLGTGLAPSQAYTLAKSLSPSYIVPVGAIDDKLVREVFFGESSDDKIKEQDKFVFTPKDFIGKENSLVYLSNPVK